MQCNYLTNQHNKTIINKPQFIFLHNKMKNFIIMAFSLVLIGFMSANLQIQTNVENAVQTIKKIFITSDWLANNAANALVTINAANDGKVYIKNALETSGAVVLNWILVNNSPVDYKVLTIGGDNNTVYKTDPAIFGSGGVSTESQWAETTTGLSTNKQVWIGEAPMDESLRVLGNSTFGSGWNRIYLFPNNSIGVGLWGITSYNNNLKINTKSWWSLFLNYDVTADTRIKWKIAAGEVHTPTSVIDIESTSGYDQLRLRKDYRPSSSGDINGETGDITRWNDGGKYYIYIKTPEWRRRAALEIF